MFFHSTVEYKLTYIFHCTLHIILIYTVHSSQYKYNHIVFIIIRHSPQHKCPLYSSSQHTLHCTYLHRTFIHRTFFTTHLHNTIFFHCTLFTTQIYIIQSFTTHSSQYISAISNHYSICINTCTQSRGLLVEIQ